MNYITTYLIDFNRGALPTIVEVLNTLKQNSRMVNKMYNINVLADVYTKFPCLVCLIVSNNKVRMKKTKKCTVCIDLKVAFGFCIIFFYFTSNC